MRRPARDLLLALGPGPATAAGALADADAGSGGAEPWTVAVVAAIVLGGSAVLVARWRASRPWLAAGIALSAGMVVGMYLLVIGALSQLDTGGVPPLFASLALAAVGVGAGLALWIVRRGGSQRSDNPGEAGDVD